MKMCTPMLAGAPPPQFPGNRSIDNESLISDWNTNMKYYTKYLMDLCVLWMNESLPFFERTPEDFCALVNRWNSKSATFIQRQRFRFLSNLMLKGHQNSHNETAATAWQQRNANWLSELKKRNHDNSSFENVTINAIEEMDNEAAGQLSSMELYRITAAALEGHQMRGLAYRALIDNYNSLMGTSNHKDNPCVDLSTLPIFAQYNLSYDPKVREITTMLKDMRRAIHKLAHSLLVTKDPLKIHSEVTLMPSTSLSHMMHSKNFVQSSKRTSQW
jgi:hypothetical protein